MSRTPTTTNCARSPNLRTGMILSDRTIRECLASGRIVIDPLDPACIQPSSVDLHVDRWFRLFRNHTTRGLDEAAGCGSLSTRSYRDGSHRCSPPRLTTQPVVEALTEAAFVEFGSKGLVMHRNRYPKP